MTQAEQQPGSDQLSQLASAIQHCAKGQQKPFRNRLKRMHTRLKQRKNIMQGFAQLEKDIQQSQQQLLLRKQNMPAVTYPESLPISQKRQRIADAIRQSQVVIVAGETGSGKTTQIPKICLELGCGMHGMIGHTQPRRIAARSVATRIAAELNSPLGKDVGYKVRFSDHTQGNTYIKLMTDGILLAEIQQDPNLNHYDTIIIDEAHERSLNIDFLLGYLKNILPKRPDLKVIITSATINTERFSEFFNHAPIIEVSGRSFPVNIEYRPVTATDNNAERAFSHALITAVDEAASYDPLGDILIFLPGEREIRDTAHALQEHLMRDTEILPLYSRLSPAEQDRVFKSHHGRRIVLATNVAETSLTVPGIRFVIDSGLARISRYSAQSKVQRLPIEAISQASANQRAGRCGRVAAGVCFRLYSEDEFNQRPEHTDPEIRRTHLGSVILQMMNLGLGDIQAFNFMEPPEKRAISDGYHLLEELQAVEKNTEKNTLTATGKKLVRMPVDPRLARMLMQAERERSLDEVLIIVAALSVQNPRVRPTDAQSQADEKHRLFRDKTSDFLSWLKLWHWYQELSRQLSKSRLKKICQQHYLVYMRMREWHDLHGQLLIVARELGLRLNQQAATPDAIHKAILAGLLSHVAVKSPDKGFLGARNLKLSIFPGSPLAKKPPQWFMAGSLVETSRLFARTIAPIDPAWLEELAGHLIKRQYSEPHWSSKQAQVLVFGKVSLYGLPIVARRRTGFGAIDPVVSRQLFIRHALVMHEFHCHAPFFKHNQKLLHDIEKMEHKTRRKDLMSEEQVRYDFFDQIIPAHVFSGKLFEQWRKTAEQQQPHLLFLNKAMLLNDLCGDIDLSRFPNVMQINKLKLKLQYRFDSSGKADPSGTADPTHKADGVTVRVPMQALGQLDAARFEWLVPGMLEEKLRLLIKGLPKGLRKNFVPAPQFARACAESMTFGEGSLLFAFAKELKRMTGVEVGYRDWNLDALSHHLRMNFAVLNEHGTSIAQGSNLPLLQHQFSAQLREHIQQAGTNADISRTGITRWDFDVLPSSIERQQGRSVMQFYPALVDHQQSVAIALFENEALAHQAMHAGCRRLMMLTLSAQVKLLKQSMPRQREIYLYYATIGNSDDLLDQIICNAFDAVFFDAATSDVSLDDATSDHEKNYPRSQRDFEHLVQTRKSKVVRQGEAIALYVCEALKAHASLQQSLSQIRSAALKPVVDDIRAQIDQLIYPGFIAQTPARWLAHLPRFMQAAEIRLSRAGPRLKQDQINAGIIQSLWQPYQQEMTQRQQMHLEAQPLHEFRWLLEELRIALFAQSIKTSVPVSAKRLATRWQEMQRQLTR